MSEREKQDRKWITVLLDENGFICSKLNFLLKQTLGPNDLRELERIFSNPKHSHQTVGKCSLTSALSPLLGGYETETIRQAALNPMGDAMKTSIE